jgi:membrane peptidoglycan carboxypeptidase
MPGGVGTLARRIPAVRHLGVEGLDSSSPMPRTRKPVPVHNLKVTRRGKVKKRFVAWRMRRAFYVLALVMTVGVAGLIYVLGQVELPVDPRVAPVEDQTSFICSSEVQVNCNASNAMAQLHGTEDRDLVTYGQIPEVLKQAVLAAEDKDFFSHDGVDPMGIARAAYRDIRNEGVRQGGSTITQQYVKQTYLSSEQTFTRKIKEAVMAVKLEQEISKEEILTRYLNTVYFGRGAYGVQAASRVWFGHEIAALDAGEAAFLAGLLRSPERADPYRSEDALATATRRRSSVLVNMESEG